MRNRFRARTCKWSQDRDSMGAGLCVLGLMLSSPLRTSCAVSPLLLSISSSPSLLSPNTQMGLTKQLE